MVCLDSRLSHYAGVPVHISAYIVDTNTRDCNDDEEAGDCQEAVHDDDGAESDSGISDTNHDSDQDTDVEKEKHDQEVSINQSQLFISMRRPIIAQY